MAGHAEEFAQRLQSCTESDTVRGLMFNSVAETADRLALPASRHRLGQPTPSGWGTLHTYPASEFLRLLFAVAEANLSGGVEPDETWRVLGAGCAHTFLASTLGRSLVALFRQVGPDALLPRVPAAFRLFAGYGSRSVELLAPGDGMVRFRGELVPAAFHLGVFDAGLRAVQLMPRLEITPLSQVDFDLHAQW